MTLASGLLAIALLQAAPPGPRNLVVTITDDKGAPVTGVSRDEVVVMEAGQARTVTRFDRDDRPLDVALLVDTSQPMASIFRLNLLEPVMQVLSRLPAGARYALWTTGDRPTKLVDWGDDVAVAERSLKRVIPSGGNTMLDALVEAARDMKDREERRPVVLAVTGMGIGFTDRDRRRVVDEGVETGVQFWSVQFDEAGDTGVQAAGGGQVSREDYDYVCSELARRSGGRNERMLSALGVRGALEKLAAELQSQYRLTYEASAGKDAKIEVQAARPGVKVRWSARPEK